MSKKVMSQKKLRWILAITSIVAVVGILHFWHPIYEWGYIYPALFAILYGILTLLLLWLIYAVHGWLKIVAVIMAALAMLLLAFDIFAIALLGYS